MGIGGLNKVKGKVSGSESGGMEVELEDKAVRVLRFQKWNNFQEMQDQGGGLEASG